MSFHDGPWAGQFCRNLGRKSLGAESKAALRLFNTLLLTAARLAQRGTTDLSDAILEELSKIQVYSASKHTLNASQAPASITVVTADDIQNFGSV